MSDSVLSAVISDLRDQSRGSARSDGNNLALADQLQFSSLLKVMVTTPEKEIQQAQANGKSEASEFPIARAEDEPDQRPKAKETERTEQRPAPAKSDASDPEPKNQTSFDPEAAKEDISDVSDAPVQPAQTTAANEGAAESDGDVPAAVPSDVLVAKADATVQTTSVKPTPAEKPVSPASIGSDATPVTSRSAAANLSAALTDMDFSDTADQLYTATNKPEIGARTGNAQNATAANALAAKQAAALSDKLGLGSQANQVSISVDTAASTQSAKSNLAPSTLLAAMETEAGGQPLLANQYSPGGSDTGTQQKGQSGANGQIGSQGQAPQQADAQALNQAFRAQVLAANAQASSPANSGTAKAVSAPVEPIALNSVSGLPGPSQVSQTTKANPTTAARYPHAMQSPAEQIAVQIRKGFAGGADKINIRLNPSSLGRVEVKLEVGHDGRITAAITAEKPETLDLLQRDARVLERALQDAGLKASSDSLNFSLKGESGNHAQSGTNGNGHSSMAPSEYADMPVEDRDHGILNNNEVYGRNLAADGHVDIRV